MVNVLIVLENEVEFMEHLLRRVICAISREKDPELFGELMEFLRVRGVKSVLTALNSTYNYLLSRVDTVEPNDLGLLEVVLSWLMRMNMTNEAASLFRSVFSSLIRRGRLEAFSPLMKIYGRVFACRESDDVISVIEKVADDVHKALIACRDEKRKFKKCLDKLFRPGAIESFVTYESQYCESSRVWSSIFGARVMERILATMEESGGVIEWIRVMEQKSRDDFLEALKEYDLDLAIKVINESGLGRAVKYDLVCDLISNGRMREALSFIWRHIESFCYEELFDFALSFAKGGFIDEAIDLVRYTIESQWGDVFDFFDTSDSQITFMEVLKVLLPARRTLYLINLADKLCILEHVVMAAIAGGYFDLAWEILRRDYIISGYTKEELEACRRALRAGDLKSALLSVSKVFLKRFEGAYTDIYYDYEEEETALKWFSEYVIPAFINIGNIEGAVQIVEFMLDAIKSGNVDKYIDACRKLADAACKVMSAGRPDFGRRVLMDLLAHLLTHEHEDDICEVTFAWIIETVLKAIEGLYTNGFHEDAFRVLNGAIMLLMSRKYEYWKELATQVFIEEVTRNVINRMYMRGHLDDKRYVEYYSYLLSMATTLLSGNERSNCLKHIISSMLEVDPPKGVFKEIVMRLLEVVGNKGGEEESIFWDVDLAISDILSVFNSHIYLKALENRRLEYFDRDIARRLVEIVHVISRETRGSIDWNLVVTVCAYGLITEINEIGHEILRTIWHNVSYEKKWRIFEVLDELSLLRVMAGRILSYERALKELLDALFERLLKVPILATQRDSLSIDDLLGAIERALHDGLLNEEREVIKWAISRLLGNEFLRLLIALEISRYIASKGSKKVAMKLFDEVLELISRTNFSLYGIVNNWVVEGIRTFLNKTGSKYTQAFGIHNVHEKYLKSLPSPLISDNEVGLCERNVRPHHLISLTVLMAKLMLISVLSVIIPIK